MDIKSHQRINQTLLTPLEKPVLQILASKMPRWVTPDVLTAVGILGAMIIFISYCLTNLDRNFLWLVDLGFAINWFGDSLDGTLARYRKIERPKYGFFLDHTVDAFNEFIIVMGLGLSPYVNFAIACLGLIGYLLLSVLVYVRTAVDGVFQISYGQLGPTEVRIIFILLNTIMYFMGFPKITLPFGVLSVYDLIVGILAAILILIFIGSSIKSGIELSNVDQK
jgi:archaetidylinositol phosphate synthase